MDHQKLKSLVFGANNENFADSALQVFHFQYDNNPVYKNYVDAFHIDTGKVNYLNDIPFLPIRFFKTHTVRTSEFEPERIFESSGTTGSKSSKHFVKNISLYEESFLKCFEFFYGDVKKYCILGLLPSYLERTNSSLVYMVEKLINLSEHPQSDFYLYEFEKLAAVLQELERRKQKTILFGVTYALLDLAEKFSFPLQHTVIIETGGMKGRKDELIREEVHAVLKRSFHLDQIHSEYGMTELLSQAYSNENGVFYCPAWMKVLLRDEEDPLSVMGYGMRDQDTTQTGAINIVDLANIYSCSFIATDDLGKLHPDDSFEVLGRTDNSDMRGCSLMYRSDIF